MTPEQSAKRLEQKYYPNWRSPYDPPVITSSIAPTVLVWLEVRDNPPALNAPGKLWFAHHIERPTGNDTWPDDGWFIHSGVTPDYYKVAAWMPLPRPPAA